jgi:hypothetical protein
MRRERLTEHEGTIDHRSAMTQETAAREFRICSNKVLQERDHILLNLTIVVYGLFKLNDSLEAFADRCFLAEATTVRIPICDKGDKSDTKYSYHHQDLGKVYRNRAFAREMGFHISRVLKLRQAKRVSKSSVFGNAVDEATDRDKKSSLIQYVSFIENGKGVKEFSNLIPVNKADAESLFEADSAALAEMFEGDVQVMHSKHFSFGSDGASVMTGKDNGVAARYKEENPRLSSNHCICHKSSLCGTNASSDIPEIGTDWKQKLHSMYNHFNLSVKKRVAFADAQRKLQMKEAQMKKDFFTRWLSLGDATQSALTNVLPMHKYLTEEDKDLVGDGASDLIKTLESHQYLLTLHAMNDILAVLNRMNLIMQSDSISFRSVSSQQKWSAFVVALV